MKDFQGLLMLSGLNALMTGGYLTTRGRDIAADRLLLRRPRISASSSDWRAGRS